MRKFLACLLLALASCQPAFAVPISSINPGIPANGAPNSSAPIRQNFQAAYNDLNRLFNTQSTYGTMALQNADAVAILGGTINGTTIGGATPAAGTFSTLTLNGLAPGLLFLPSGSAQATTDIGFFYDGSLLMMVHSNTGGQQSVWDVFCDSASGCGSLYRDDYGLGTSITFDATEGGNNFVNFLTNNNSHDGSTGGLNFYADSGQFGANPLGTGDEVGHFFFGSQNASQSLANIKVTAAAGQSGTSSPGLECHYITKNGVKVLPTTAVFCADDAQHLTLPSTEAPPAVSSCGGGTPSVTGNDQDFDITTGTGAPTACTLTFGKAFKAAPHCTANASAGFITIGTPPSTTAVTLTISAGLTSGHVYGHCF